MLHQNTRNVNEYYFIRSVFCFSGGYYAPNGSVVDWWSRNTTSNFLTTRQCLIDYYNTIEAGPYRTKSSDRGGEMVCTDHFSSVMIYTMSRSLLLL